MGRADVFVGDGAADGGLVHAHDVGDLRHGERAELVHALLEEVALDLEDLAGDALDGLLALLDGVDDELAGAHALAEVVALLLGEGAPGDHLLVCIRNPETRDVVVVEVDLPLVLVLFDGDVGHDDAVVVVGELAAGGGVEAADLLDGVLHVVEVDAGLARDLGDAAAGEELEVVAHDAGGEALALAVGAELEEEAFAQVGGADAGGLEGLEEGGGLLRGVEGKAGLEGGLGGRLGEEAAFVEAADEVAEGGLHVLGGVDELGLAEQMLLEGGFGDEGVEEVLAALGVLGGVGLGAGALGEIVAPVVAELGEHVELLGKIHGLGAVGGGVVGGGRGGVGAVVGVGRGGVVQGGVGGGVEAVGVVGNVLEGGVALEFVLDDGAQVEGGDLKNFQRLAKLGGEDERLALPLAKVLVKSGAH